jgi:catechol 2,3-dioxygenase-like lactoylglutathione lyase family enzyme
MSGKVVGIGGVFFKSKDPKALTAWYAEHLGFTPDAWGGVMFHEPAADDPRPRAYTLWTPFEAGTDYLRPSTREFMINLRVDDVEALVTSLRAKGVEVHERGEDGEYGRFRYVLDPEGTLLELWQPPG